MILPESDYFKYIYPNQYSILDPIGIPCMLRSDLRTSFLSYYSRTPNTRIRRYEFGTVIKSNRDHNSLINRYSASIDNIWLQKYPFILYIQ